MTAAAVETTRRPNYRTLILNADFRPLQTYPLSIIAPEDAIKAVFRERVSVVEEWDAVYRSPSRSIRIPKVVALRQYAPINAAPKFCRRSILLRDNYRCQYCGEQFESAELTFDHVIPRAAGGQTVWSNILSCCIACNTRKSDTLPNYSGRRRHAPTNGAMRPLKEPRQPTTAELLRAGLQFLDADTRETFADYLYWGVELQA